jgi:hypothetical protein
MLNVVQAASARSSEERFETRWKFATESGMIASLSQCLQEGFSVLSIVKNSLPEISCAITL